MDFIENAFDAVGNAVGSVADTVFSAFDKNIAEPILSPMMNAIGNFLQPILMNGNVWMTALTAGFGNIAGAASAVGGADGAMSAADAEGWLGGGSGNTLGSSTTGVSTNPVDVLSDGSAAAGGSAAPSSGGSLSQADAEGWLGGGTNAAGQVVGPTGAPTGGGLINGFMNFAKANPTTALGMMNLGSSVIGGIGNNITQNQLMDKKIQGEKEMLAQKTLEEQKLAEWRRRFIQGGSYFDAKLPFNGGAPAQPLTRPGGAPVYGSGGVINGVMTPGG